MPNGLYGGVRGRGLIAPSYSISDQIVGAFFAILSASPNSGIGSRFRRLSSGLAFRLQVGASTRSLKKRFRVLPFSERPNGTEVFLARRFTADVKLAG